MEGTHAKRDEGFIAWEAPLLIIVALGMIVAFAIVGNQDGRFDGDEGKVLWIGGAVFLALGLNMLRRLGASSPQGR